MTSISAITVIHNKDGGLEVRHALTTSLGNPENREPSIRRVLDYIAKDVRESFEQSLASKNYFADDIAEITIQVATEQKLTGFVTEGLLRDWESVSVNLSVTDPTRFVVRGRIVPRYPLNGIDFSFTI